MLHVVTRDYGVTDLETGRFRLHSQGELKVKDGLIALGLKASDVRSAEDLWRVRLATAEAHARMVERAVAAADGQRRRRG